MSVRIEFSGFDVEKLRALSGSRDRDALMTLTLTARDRFIDPVMNANLESIVRRAVETGFPFQELQDESSVHITAASIMASYNQTHLGFASNNWRADVLLDLEEPVSDKQASQLIKYLKVGRPLFGKRIVADPRLYAFLSLEEVQYLRRFLPKPTTFDLRQPASSNALGYVDIAEVDSFPTELATWLKALDEKKQDLWLFET